MLHFRSSARLEIFKMSTRTNIADEEDWSDLDESAMIKIDGGENISVV